MVGLAQLVRASDCGPEGRRFNSDIPPHEFYPTANSGGYASVVQRLVCKFSKLEMRFRLPPLAPEKNLRLSSGFFLPNIFYNKRKNYDKVLDFLDNLCYNGNIRTRSLSMKPRVRRAQPIRA